MDRENMGEDTRLLYCTTGVLKNKLIQAKHMNAYTHVVLDEVNIVRRIDVFILYMRAVRRRPLMIWGGARGNRQKNKQKTKVFLQEKKTKTLLQEILKDLSEEKINLFPTFPLPHPRSLMVSP